MKTKIGSFSVLMLALMFGLSTIAFSQGEKKTTTSTTGKKTEQTQPVVKENKTKIEKPSTTMATKDSKSGHKKHNKKDKTPKTMTPDKK